MVYNTTFLLRRGTKESWERNNPILAYGEPGYDSTNYGLKIGDGKTHWNDLHFMSTTEEEIEKAIKDYFEKNPGSGGSGLPGKDGISATHEWNGSVLTITSASGSSSSNLLGPKGDPGRGIASILRTSGNGEPGSIDIYTITYSDGTTDRFSVYNGKDGLGGGNETGENGATFVPSISDGILSWTNDKNLENPEPVNIIGPQGESGYTPQKGIDYWTNEDKQEIISELPAPDLTGYATENWVQDNYQPKGEYLTEHQDISGKLDSDKLPEAINIALTQAKESGEFDGQPGNDGKSAYEYAQDGGYTGTEEEFATKLAAEYLPISGGDMTGAINMNGHKIKGLNAPTEDDEPATKGYVDAKKLSMELLWENDSPTSPFEQKKFGINFESYDSYVLLTMVSTQYQYVQYSYAPCGKNIAVSFEWADDGVYYSRVFRPDGNYIFVGQGWASKTKDDNAIIPYQIYGIKGVS